MCTRTLNGVAPHQILRHFFDPTLLRLSHIAVFMALSNHVVYIQAAFEYRSSCTAKFTHNGIAEKRRSCSLYCLQKVSTFILCGLAIFSYCSFEILPIQGRGKQQY